MSRSEAFLSSAVQAASKIHSVQDNIVAVKIHPDSISVLQLDPAVDASSPDGWCLDRLSPGRLVEMWGTRHFKKISSISSIRPDKSALKRM